MLQPSQQRLSCFESGIKIANQVDIKKTQFKSTAKPFIPKKNTIQ